MWYYVINGQQQGPFDEAQFEGLIAGGTVTPGTYVWKEGLPNWLPLGQVRSGMASGDTCQVCHKPVGADNLIELAGVRVCAACKPLAVQSLREGIALGADGVWSEGQKIVTTDGTTFPARCVKCNAAASGEPLKRKLYWHPPSLYILIFVGLLFHIGIIIYLIVAIIVRRKATVYMHLCPTHRQRRLYALIVRWSAVPVAMILSFAGIAYHTPWLAAVGGLVLIMAVITGLTFGRVTRTALINKDKTVRLKGAGKEFIASLPPWTGS